MSDLDDWENQLTDDEEVAQQKEQEEKKIAEEKRKEKEKLAAKQKLKKDNEDFEKLDATAKKLKLREIELKNDAQNTLDLFGVSPTKETESLQTQPSISRIEVSKSSDIAVAVEEISNALDVNDKIEVEFYQSLMRELLQDLSYIEIREITSALDTMANEKQRQEKGKGKKKKKKQVTVERASSNMREFEDFI